ncbi:TIGR04282 family arsenosugar biosynthesis glycosyltransferase [Aquimarina gracilis]|uniref:TIGR04282 family arsenosugar biosynthesis glycosyltransferase n=1 Tax=Aquimarina gracilis TaxID=874422 RepID=A0ABU5ZUM6_9FLAO|nr:TIGR04282 family arsenosugar biosynthesis glycosyltransferase [Aquimarina gracilis]MEB3345257.1 TIGR04282 family arsenosugar biosynthesis glycosyltransferase [Aquimarina gracilis]
MVTKREKSIYKLKEKNLLLIFTRNPELGKCKTRLAAKIGNQAALEVYKFLLHHTVTITKNLNVTKQVQYSVAVRENDLWSSKNYEKRQQFGDDLGQRMENAFKQGFNDGYQNIIIIGSDIYDLTQADLDNAFKQLETHDYVIGPAQDGGYYLFGMKSLNSQVFKNKVWGTETVLKDTLNDLQKSNVKLLEERNDVDYYEDIKDVDVFQKFLNQ